MMIAPSELPARGRYLSVAPRPRFSIIVPAHNEEALLQRGLNAIETAIARTATSAEIVVVANRCTDRTESIAEAAGTIVVRDGHRNIAATRNAGVAASTGDIVVTIDADTIVHPHALTEVDRLVRTGTYVGGGCRFDMERHSLGLAVTKLVVTLATTLTRTGGVMYWCSREDFDAIGGFDEARLVGEDLDFAYRLRRHGRVTKRRFHNLRGAPAMVSVRKFDTFGDWHYLTKMGSAIIHPRQLRDTFRGTTFVDEYFYDYNT
jgi:glycosyltransferase involved in cell wall biosynthesis